MRRRSEIAKGPGGTVKAVGQGYGDEIYFFGRHALILNVSEMKRAAETKPHIFRPMAFNPAEAGPTLARYSGGIDIEHSDRMPPDVLAQPGMAIQVADDAGWIIDGHHRLSRLHRAGSTRPWMCHGFTLSQARLFQIQYYRATETGWRLLDLEEIVRIGLEAGYWGRPKTAKRRTFGLIQALAM